MRLNKYLSAYPILAEGDDDYVDSYYDVKIESQSSFGKLGLSITHKCNNKGLISLIKNGDAVFLTHVECSLLGFRNTYSCDAEMQKIEIDLNNLSNDIEVSCFIVATKNISNYYDEKFNWEFGDVGVNIECGNVLAIGPTYYIEIDRNNNKLKKLSDVIKIDSHNDNKKEMEVNLEGNVILILISKNAKKLYSIHGDNYYKYNVISMILVPAMIYILTMMKNNTEAYQEKKWFKIIEKLLNENGVKVEELDTLNSNGKKSVFTLAQDIFKAPLDKGLEELSRDTEEEHD